MSNELPWGERVNRLSVNPDAASRDDIAKLARELMEKHKRVWELEEQRCKSCEFFKHETCCIDKCCWD